MINLLWKYGICFGNIMLSVILIQRDDVYRRMYYFFAIKVYVPESIFNSISEFVFWTPGLLIPSLKHKPVNSLMLILKEEWVGLAYHDCQEAKTGHKNLLISLWFICLKCIPNLDVICNLGFLLPEFFNALFM